MFYLKVIDWAILYGKKIYKNVVLDTYFDETEYSMSNVLFFFENIARENGNFWVRCISSSSLGGLSVVMGTFQIWWNHNGAYSGILGVETGYCPHQQVMCR